MSELTSMFNKIKEISMIGFADIIGSVIAASFWFYLAILIDVEKYGELNYLLSFAQMASGFALLGATNTIIVYSAKNVKIHATLYFLSLLAGIVAAVIVFFTINDIYTSFLILGYLAFSMAYSDLLGKKLFKKYTIFILTQKSLMVVLSLGFYFILDIQGIILGMVIAHFLGLYRIIIGFRDSKIDIKLLKDRWKFVFSNIFNTVTASLSGTADRIIIGNLFGFALLGNYSLGLQFITMMSIIPVIFSKFLIPKDSKGEDTKKIKRILIIISIIISGLGFFVGPEVISIFFSKFNEADNILRIVSLSIIPSTIALTYHTKFLGAEKSFYVLITGIIKTAVLIIMIILLGSLYKIEGIAIAIVLASIADMTYSFLMSKRIV